MEGFPGTTLDEHQVSGHFEIRLLTPDDAGEILEHWMAPQQRSVQPATVKRYANDIRAGVFDVQPQTPILVTGAGQVINGRHRLRSCVEAGEPITVPIWFGCPESALWRTDQGRSRTGRDALALRGEANPSVIAGAVRILLGLLKQGNPNPTSLSISNDEVLAMLGQHPRLKESAQFAGACKFLPKAMLAVIHYLAAEHLHKAETADEFVAGLASGAGLDADDPRLVVRDIFAEDLRSRSRKRSLNNRFYILVKAWETFARGGRYPNRRQAHVFREPVRMSGLTYRGSKLELPAETEQTTVVVGYEAPVVPPAAPGASLIFQ